MSPDYTNHRTANLSRIPPIHNSRIPPPLNTSPLNGSLRDTTTDDGIKLHGFLVTAALNPTYHSKEKSPNTHPRLWIVIHGVNGNFYGSSLLTDLAKSALLAGDDALLINTRGHDLASFGSADIPARLGSMYETLQDASLDLKAWITLAHSLSYKSVGIIAHSLGAVKTLYAAAHQNLNIQHIIALSPPRMNTELLLNDPEKQNVFRKHLEEARQACELGEPHRILRVRFPLPNWVSANTFIDKYGNDTKYDYLHWFNQIPIPTLWLFGEHEVRTGSLNFRNADQALAEQFQAQPLAAPHELTVIPQADHSYRTTRETLSDVVFSYIQRVNLH